jgi:hypothetical protein
MPTMSGHRPDPLARFGAAGAARADRTPLPLAGERMRIVIRGSLALVERAQTFRNGEDISIEATLTFPVPVHATLCRLVAAIGGRTLVASALPRDKARDRYEEAVDDGKTAVLHEELLRGIHMLSIAHIPPGSVVTVAHGWIAALAPRSGGKGMLRIPVTLGDVYGDSPFGDADDLVVSRDVVHEAEIALDAGAAAASIAGVTLIDGRARWRLDAPLDLEIAALTSFPVRGVSADGRDVRVSVFPDGGDADIDAAILVDRSGSMGAAVSTRAERSPGSPRTKHATVAMGLAAAAQALRPADRVELWQFDNTVERVSSPALPLLAAIARLGSPRGGTEIGAALSAVVASSPARDVILITDGLSHALEVQRLANSERRFTVVLVGEDSLEANVGRLAALSGGQILLATGPEDAADAVARAIASTRRSQPSFAGARWPVERAALAAGGAIVEAVWEPRSAPIAEPDFAAAVGALAAAIALPRLPEEEAARVAADHGIVCHLTSLVLVDEAGAAQATLPAQRKVPLMAMRCRAPAGAAAAPVQVMARSLERRSAAPLRPVGRGDARTLGDAARQIDWGANPEALRRGDLTALPAEIAALVIAACEVPAIAALAAARGNAIAIVIGLMARSLGASNRAAQRVAKATLAGLDEDALRRAMAALGLLPEP